MVLAMLKHTLALALLLFLACALAQLANAQSLPLGTLTIQGNDPYPCTGAANSADFLPGANCFDATVSGCPNNVASIGLTFGWAGPATPAGTIVFFGRGAGNEAHLGRRKRLDLWPGLCEDV